MDKDKAIELLKGGLDGVKEWNQYREDGGVVPNLSGADLSGADLSDVDLSSARLITANLNRADLNLADLNRANLTGANITYAFFTGADLKDIKNWIAIVDLNFTNIYSVKNPPDGFIKFAKEKGAVEMDWAEWTKHMWPE